MRRTILCILLIPLLFAALSASDSNDTAARIERIEKGLLPAVAIEADEPWTIDQRMQHYAVPAWLSQS